MATFMLLYNGPATPPDASHEGWPEWFQSLGDKLVDRGSPMTAAVAAAADPTAPGTASSLNGYTIIRARDRDAVGDLLRNHPFLAHGSDYRIDVYELPGK